MIKKSVQTTEKRGSKAGRAIAGVKDRLGSNTIESVFAGGLKLEKFGGIVKVFTGKDIIDISWEQTGKPYIRIYPRTEEFKWAEQYAGLPVEMELVKIIDADGVIHGVDDWKEQVAMEYPVIPKLKVRGKNYGEETARRGPVPTGRKQTRARSKPTADGGEGTLVQDSPKRRGRKPKSQI